MGRITLKRILMKESIITLSKIFIPGVLFIGLMALYSLNSSFHFNDLTEDAIQTMKAPKHLGLVSRAGIVMMCATAAILLFASAIAYTMKKPREVIGFLLAGGLFSFLLMCDDYFMFHDWVFRDIIPINENVIFAFYAISAVLFLFYYRQLILNTDYIILLIGFALLGVSVIVDAAMVIGFDWAYHAILEDGSKFLGMVCWFAYFLITSFDLIRLDITNPRS